MDLLGWAALLSLAADCGPDVHPVTTAAIIQVESQGNPLVIADNTRRTSYTPHTQAQAIWLANQLHQQGHSLDIGVMQINTQWLRPKHLTLEKLFDPCFNIAVGTDILATAYQGTLRQSDDAATALTRALSIYNTGSPTAGRAYVTRVMTAVRRTTPVSIATRAPDAALSFTDEDGVALNFTP
jgi:type IV secretion system protein VirB1